MANILLVDDDPQALESTRKLLELSGHQVTTAGDGEAALEFIRPSKEKLINQGNDNNKHLKFDLIITDVRMPKLGGLEFLRALSLGGETAPVILMTAFGRIEDAVWAMKLGAVDFLIKPFKRQALLSALDAALKRTHEAPQVFQKNILNQNIAQNDHSLDHSLIGTSFPMQELRKTISQVAPTAATILLTGESGTGKELVANCIHQQSTRSKKRLIALNCAAVPEHLMESELFGFEKGAFTGATTHKEGLFEAAHEGTFFLDEIGDMPLSLQAKLLRVIQEGEIRRIGATTSRKVDVRLIAATHKDLKESIRTGSFRQDLLYRLEVIGIQIPPLRERQEDIPELAMHFLSNSATRHAKQLTGISVAALKIIQAHSWPGNVRELSNVIERAVVFAQNPEIIPDDLPAHLIAISTKAIDVMKISSASIQGSTIPVPLGAPLKDVEELLIRKTLEATAGDKNMTAKLLGINSRTIYRKLDKR